MYKVDKFLSGLMGCGLPRKYIYIAIVNTDGDEYINKIECRSVNKKNLVL